VDQASLTLSLIIVSWNVRELLANCLDSIITGLGGRPGQAELSYEVIVVDNHSSDGTVDWLRQNHPWVHLIANCENLGFTKANNQGIAHSRGSYLFLLNPDTEVVGPSLQVVVEFMEHQQDVGAVGPQLLWPDGSVQSSRRRFPTYSTGFIESTPLQSLLPGHRLLRRYFLEDVPDDVVQEVDWVVGAALMLRRQALDQVGPLDERFFMYSEELDLAFRLRQAGWKVIFLPEAKVLHHEARSSSQVSTRRLLLFHTSKVQYYAKVFGRPRGELLRLFLLGAFAVQWLIECSKWIIGHKRELRRQRMSAYARALRSGLLPSRVTPPQATDISPCAFV